MLSQTATYALRAMAFLASRTSDRPVLSKTIADEMEIPRNFLSKIMHRLVQEKLVRSTRGTNGGFTLTRKPSDITMMNVIELFMDVSAYSSCFLGRKNCDGKCGLHGRWKPISDEINDLLVNTTLEEVS